MKKAFVNAILVFLFLILISTTGWLWWENHLLRDDVYAMSVYAGSMQASVDFQNNKVRLYELQLNGTHSFSGKSRGDFEIWYWAYFGRDYYSSDIFVSAYNRKMMKLATSKSETATIINRKQIEE